MLLIAIIAIYILTVNGKMSGDISTNNKFCNLIKEKDYDFLLIAKYGDRVYNPNEVFMKRNTDLDFFARFDAIDRFVDTPEFQALIEAWNEAISALQEPFQEIWSLIQEIMDLIGEAFGGESDPVGRGTEERIRLCEPSLQSR